MSQLFTKGDDEGVADAANILPAEESAEQSPPRHVHIAILGTGFAGEVQKRMQGTVWTSGCASWYLDTNGHNTTLWPGFTFEFRRKTRHFAVEHYRSAPQTSPVRHGSAASV